MANKSRFSLFTVVPLMMVFLGAYYLFTAIQKSGQDGENISSTERIVLGIVWVVLAIIQFWREHKNRREVE